MPEVREVLEAHLDLSCEPTRTIRSVYGDHLTLLAWLDWNWLEANLGRILPMADADYPFFSAAWRSFVVFNSPNTRLFRAMTGCYRKAIEHLGKDIFPRHSVKSPEDALAEHLMAYYWQGALEFGGADPLLDDFFALASDGCSRPRDVVRRDQRCGVERRGTCRSIRKTSGSLWQATGSGTKCSLAGGVQRRARQLRILVHIPEI
jgi:hypothetical protein